METVSGAASASPSEYVVEASESAVLIDTRSTAGRITYGTNAIRGGMTVAGFDGGLILQPPPRGEVAIDLTSLRSGNALYDAELAQRLNVRRFPEAVVALDSAIASGGRYQLNGRVTLHGQTRQMAGSVAVKPTPDGWLVTGEQVFDMRDFDISVPSMLMLRIFPDVRVYMSLAFRPGHWTSEPAGSGR